MMMKSILIIALQKLIINNIDFSENKHCSKKGPKIIKYQFLDHRKLTNKAICMSFEIEMKTWTKFSLPKYSKSIDNLWFQENMFCEKRG